MDKARLNEVTGKIVDIAYKIHSQYGPGLLESAYQSLLEYELAKAGLRFESQKAIPIIHDGVHLGDGYRADLLVEGLVIVEVKSIEAIADVHIKQILTYLRLSGVKVGLLINFNTALIKEGIKRMIL